MGYFFAFRCKYSAKITNCKIFQTKIGWGLVEVVAVVFYAGYVG
jgi:hypothetical protein